SGVGSGGMITKIEAGKIALSGGCHMVIASGHELHPLQRIMSGERCTWFLAEANALQARKRWIAGTLQPVGHLIVDDGAKAALDKGKSLLPAGVKKVEGNFQRGDTVSIMLGHKEFARGLVAYDAEDARKMAGHKSAEVAKLVGVDRGSELVHRDDLVML
ncbi:MAG: glutamate 5-kinase, partial [Alphaproteobacteria bacterium]|nr:glutamate 5-kinase [Alphaproteobacteria bacterium]